VLQIKADIREGGVAKYIETLNLLFTGGNNGKLILKF
jgi:NADPH-dependent curcumin reductase CurA